MKITILQRSSKRACRFLARDGTGSEELDLVARIAVLGSDNSSIKVSTSSSSVSPPGLAA
jgi:hypothetical protein